MFQLAALLFSLLEKEFRTTSKEAYLNYQDDYKQEFGQQSFDNLN